MKTLFLAIPVFLLSIYSTCNNSEKPHTDTAPHIPAEAVKGNFGIGFYNVENLYDTQDDPKTDDSEFLPEGRYKWTKDKYEVKLNNIAKVISQLAGDGPEVFGLVEIENREVIADLVAQPALASHQYQIVHENSKDARGVDVAFCYDPKVFAYVRHKAFTPTFATDKKTRDFLLVEGKINKETMYFIVNHWPSRREGKAESEQFRVAVAKQVKAVCDSVLKKNPKAYICMMGDFNDDPTDKSIAEVLGAKAETGQVGVNGYYNPLVAEFEPNTRGSLYYDNQWNLFDQFILSQSWINGTGKIQYTPNSAHVFAPDWVRVGFGKAKLAPRRGIFKDEFQKEGYSDHFAIYMEGSAK